MTGDTEFELALNATDGNHYPSSGYKVKVMEAHKKEVLQGQNRELLNALDAFNTALQDDPGDFINYLNQRLLEIESELKEAQRDTTR